MNPFTFGNPISDPDRFYGREDEIRKITNRLRSYEHESTSIVGERRIGKTSLLRYLASPKAAEHTRLHPDKFCLVYLDFQGLTSNMTPQRFWKRVLKKLARSINSEDLALEIKEILEQGEIDLFDLEDLFDQIRDEGMTTIFLMDEFDTITQNPAFGSDFFGGLRSLAIHHGIALVPATRQELVDLCYSEEIKGSPFFNIFGNVVLKPFSEKDAKTMIDDRLSQLDNISISQDEKNFILQIGGGHPIFLQMMGHHIVDLKMQCNEGLKLLKGEEIKEEAIKAFERDAHSNFKYFWNHCSESEKITLLSIMALNQQKRSGKNQANIDKLSDINARAQFDTEALIKRGLILEKENAYELFSPTFISWITREISAINSPEVKNERNAEEWLKNGNFGNIQKRKTTLVHVKEEYWPILGKMLAEVSTEAMITTGLNLLLRSMV